MSPVMDVQLLLPQSTEAFEFIKRDLTEFSNVVQHDTACSIVATASAVRNKLAVTFTNYFSPLFLCMLLFQIEGQGRETENQEGQRQRRDSRQTRRVGFESSALCSLGVHGLCTSWQSLLANTVEGSSETTEKVKKGLSSFLGVITDTLAPPPDKTIDCDVITLVATPAGTTEIYDSNKARLYCLQADPATYCNEPDGPPEQFDNWLSSFSLEEKKGDVSELLVNSPSIRALYTKMVPAAVAHSEFWQRYFYKVFQLEQEEARRVALKQRAEQTHTETLGWEEEDEDDFLGATSPSRLDFTPPLDDSAALLSSPSSSTSTTTVTGPALSPVLSSPSGGDGTALSPALSVSSDSVSLPTQVELLPEPQVTQLGQRMSAASLEEEDDDDVAAKGPDSVQVETAEVSQPPEVVAVTVGGGAVSSSAAAAPAAAPTPRPDAAKEDAGPQDLRVFELNSDSGKSTPSNNGKKGSSTDVSEDWEKDFDLDMTEEEVQMALSTVEASGELDEDWENWD